ncbi:MAG TPA: DUF1080 domain-containing protein [Gemmatimonadales bacterium]|nr:DUF1080 domain-containing protein [Gemmatimonadales bacterium]
MILGVLLMGQLQAQQWAVHSMERPRPPVVNPGPAGPPIPPPSDAVVLFDGTGLAEWVRQEDGGPAGWRVADGYMEVVRGAGSIATRRSFGDVQLHLEWMAPSPPTGEGQERGNSGVFLMGRYEIQVLDSYRSDTYADGQAAALYGQAPPLVNASRPPGEWQTYDIVFRRPRFGPDEAVLEPARVTVLHNGVLVHDNAEFTGRTAHGRRAAYQRHEDRLPLVLQDHGDPVRFRNVWVRELNR